MTATPNLNIALPTPGGEEDAWASILNDAFVSLDEVVAATQASADAAVGTAEGAQVTAAAAQATADAALPKSGGTMTGAITLAGAPTIDLHAATKAYVDGLHADAAGAANAAQATADAALPKAGGTMTGAITLAGAPTLDLHAATKAYVDAAAATSIDSTARAAAAAAQATADAALPKSGGTMTGAITLAGAPTVDLHAATKAYVDTGVANATDATARSAASAAQATADAALPKSGGTMTGALTLSGAPTVDLHAATKKYADDGDALRLLKAGDTMTGGLVMSDQQVSRAVMKDSAVLYYNSGTTNALDYVNGSHQRWAPNTGAQTLSISNWPPTGNLGELLIEGVNLGAATITWPTINWIKGDGTTTTTFASNGVTLQTSGIDWVLLWTRDAGSTIYGKIVR